MKPLAVDLYCGLGGWAAGFLAEGYDVIGFDIERRPYPGDLVLQDVLTLHGRQLRDAAIIVASPPCQEYSYRAMPWKRAKALPPSDITLFESCFRLQLQASAAAGHVIPMVVENVKGAQKWVGRAKWHYGSYYLWGDVPALMPTTAGPPKVALDDVRAGVRRPSAEHIKQGGGWFHDSRNGARRFNSRSSARRHYQAVIAKIPLPLAQHIARVYKPA